MSNPDERNIDSPRTRPEYMWLIGYEHLIDSRRLDDTFANRAASAEQAVQWFASAQARALGQIADRLGELVEQQRTANYIAACGDHRPPLNSADEMRQVNETLRRVLGLDDKPEGGTAE